MIDINEIFKKAQAEHTNTSVMFEMPGRPEKAKITIEAPGRDPVVLNDLDEYAVYTYSGEKMKAVINATIPFLMVILSNLKEKIGEATNYCMSKLRKED